MQALNFAANAPNLFRTRFLLAAPLYALGIFVSAHLLASASIASQPAAAGQRVLKFSPSFSAGRLYTGKHEAYYHGYSTAETLGQAQGTVSVPKDVPIILSASYNLAQNMSVLKALPADALTGLKLDRLDTTDLLNLGPLAHLTGLRQLEITDCNVNDEMVKQLRPLVKLEALTLRACGLNGSCFKKLQFLNLKDLNISINVLDPDTFVSLERFTELEHLILPDCNLSDQSLKIIANIPSLVELNVNSNKRVTIKGLMYLTKLKHLKRLRVGRTSVRMSDLIQLKSIYFKDLKYLGYPGTNATRVDIAKLQAAFPHTILKDEERTGSQDESLFAPLK